MRKCLVIVESPAKAKTINKYLGEKFVVKSSVGHIRDLPSGATRASADPKERARLAAITRKMSPEEKRRHKETKAKQQLFNSMGINPEKGWSARYCTLPGKEKVVGELRSLAKKVDLIYLATDMDREGEAIAWHLTQVIGGDITRFKRVVFNEITKNAIQQAFAAPGELNIDRVDAQQARRFLDRIVGFMVSPLLWEKVGRGLSAGRVQSVAVRMLVEREREIRAFEPEEFWTIDADVLSRDGAELSIEVRTEGERAFRPLNKSQADKACAQLQHAHFVVDNRDDKPTSSKPGAPFITSTMQQAASTRLRFGVKRTMALAQRLYEAGYITYMRTDSTNISQDAISSCRGFIEQNYPTRYLSKKVNVFSSRSSAQDAHECIRPSNIDIKPSSIIGVESDAARLYEIIWQQFIACQMASAEFLSTTVYFSADDFGLVAKGRITVFDGYLAVVPNYRRGERDVEVPDLKIGDNVDLLRLNPKQHFTKPPPRYSEAALVKELEKRGVGRPSTYASIISTIQDRGYVRVANRRLFAEKIGDVVTDRLLESFADLMDYGFTATMEERLDQVASGSLDWKHLLDNFYTDFCKQLDIAKDGTEGMRPNLASMTDIVCADAGCGKPMTIRTAGTGVFLGCSGYGLPPKERCKSTMNLIPGDEAVNIEEDDEAESKSLLSRKRCILCNTSMDSYLVDATRKLHVCGNNPDCEGFIVEVGQYVIKGYEGPVIDCDKCQSQMQLKTGRFGKYFGCTGTSDGGQPCKNTRKLLRSGQIAPPKTDPISMPELRCRKVEDHYVLRDGASGLFLAASQFPRHRETRAPTVAELQPYQAVIDPKHQFLLTAPTADPDGFPTVIRYSRKTKEQYIRSEKDGKAIGWSAYYSGGRWEERAQGAK
ncbi:MAG: DNA topoisomerase I subunit omega [Porticoccaceae bacterium]|nr:DNA topoisomerase I subunit omega [Porticoccaceae bacterium]|tara:strand:- start:1568 stop:4222 length:2655 start_codon:yes stop_codon:yes gene_type:complete